MLVSSSHSNFLFLFCFLTSKTVHGCDDERMPIKIILRSFLIAEISGAAGIGLVPVKLDVPVGQESRLVGCLCYLNIGKKFGIISGINFWSVGQPNVLLFNEPQKKIGCEPKATQNNLSALAIGLLRYKSIIAKRLLAGFCFCSSFSLRLYHYRPFLLP